MNIKNRLYKVVDDCYNLVRAEAKKEAIKEYKQKVKEAIDKAWREINKPDATNRVNVIDVNIQLNSVKKELGLEEK